MTNQTGLDGGSWPSPLGNSANDRTSPVPLSGKGKERWRVGLPTRHVNGVTVAANGLCFVTSERGVVALAGPTVRWSVETVAYWGCVLLGDGMLVTAEADGLVLRDQLTGSIVSVIATTPVAAPVPMSGGRLVFPASARRGRVLRSTTLTGEVCWEIGLDSWLYPPLVRHDQVVVTDGSVVRAFDRDGSPVWSAGPDEFRTAPDAVTELGEPADVDGPPVGLPAGKVLVPIQTEDVTGYLVVDPERGEAHALPAHLPPGAVVVPLGDLLVLRGWPDRGDHGDSLPTVTVVDVGTGTVVGHHRVPAEAQSMVAGANGLVAVAGSPTWDRWVKYHGWPGYDLRDDCYVLFLDKDGVRAEWKAGRPITGPLAVGADGDVLVPVSGQLVSVE